MKTFLALLLWKMNPSHFFFNRIPLAKLRFFAEESVGLSRITKGKMRIHLPNNSIILTVNERKCNE
jgi:hypothetical protein